MRTFLRRGLYVSLFVALCFSLTSCDSGGSSGGDLKWVGNWEVTNADELTYWLLTEDELEIRSFSGNNEDNCVGSLTVDIVDSGSSEFTGRAPDGGELTFEIEGSGDDLTAVPSASGEDNRNLSAVDSVPPCDQ
jgi:hypothetical protein